MFFASRCETPIINFLLNLCFFEPAWLFYLKFNLSKTIFSLAVKCQAMENTYSKNSSVIPGKFNIYRSCIKSPIEVLKYN
jgi:hypothetical protein